jgi:hypothetical protein
VSLLERLRSPGSRAFRDAGPPDSRLLAALAGSGILVVVLGWTVVGPDTWPLLAVIPVGLTLGIALSDRDGWAMREAMVFVAVEQRRRFARGRLPTSPREADTWLADPAHGDATGLERASVLLVANRYADALALLDAAGVTTDLDRVRSIRIRSTVETMTDPSKPIDVDGVRKAAASLPIEERRYQVVSAAWSQAWVDVIARRPWRQRFAAVAREFQPYPLPRHMWLFGVALQELSLPLILALGLGLLYLIVQG